MKNDELSNNHHQNWQQAYKAWLLHPQVDEETKYELKSLQGNEVEIRDRFDGDLDFGTGGMRGIIGAGTRRINRYVVRKATQGFANYLLKQHSHMDEKKAAIAYDSRRYSKEFAEETALVLAANGIQALLFDDMRPLPVLSFAVRETGSLAGIVITASHNPPCYNGYKIYGKDGGQAVPELAKPVIKEIRKLDIFRDVQSISREDALNRGLLHYLGEEMDRLYLEKIKSLTFMPGDANIRVVYSALHGSGIRMIPRALGELGYTSIFIQKDQAVADPDFSTVTVPNPEDPAAFALSLKLAEEKNADLILATDPDADRVGCAVKSSPGQYTLLNGNQTGALLVNYLLSRLKEEGRLPSNGVIIKTVVTGNLGKKIAESFGIKTLETLTGFKYIGEKIKEFEESKAHQFLFGYEESYGYLAGTFSRDKDAVVASVLMVEMAAYYKQAGKTLLQILDELLEKHGYFLEELESIELENMSLAAQILEEMKMRGFSEVAGNRVVEIRDYSNCQAVNLLTREQRRMDLPQSDVLYYLMEDESWFCVRPSGTEPKIKFYFAITAENQELARKKMQTVKETVLERFQQPGIKM